VEGIYFEETFSPAERLEAMRMFLVFACFRNFKIYQMDVKSTFLNETLEEEVYVEKLEGFMLTKNKDYVCKLKKALYGLKQAPRAWFSSLDEYLEKKKDIREGLLTGNYTSKFRIKTGLLWWYF
jgi:hypothetical protein